MSNDNNIKETLEVIRKALEDDSSENNKVDILILNKKINDDGTIDYINTSEDQNQKINKIIDDKLEKLINQKLPRLIDKHIIKKNN